MTANHRKKTNGNEKHRLFKVLNQALMWTAGLGTHNPDTFYDVSNFNGVIDIEEAHAYADEYDNVDTPQIWDWNLSENFCLWV